MVNKFDQPIQSQFINTYVPIPFEQMQQAVATRQAKLDENLERLYSANAATQNLNYISNSVDEEYIKGKVQPGMENLVNKFATQDLSDPVVYNALRSEMSTVLDRGRVKDIQDSYASWQTNQNVIRDLTAKGKYSNALDLMNPAEGYDSRKGVYDYTTEGMLDVKAAASKYFDDLTPRKGFDPQKGVEWAVIDDYDLERAAREHLRDFLDTKEGEQAVRIAAYRRDEDYNKLDKATKQMYAYDALIQAGDEFRVEQYGPMPGYASMMNNQGGGVNPWISPTDNTFSVKVASNSKLDNPNEKTPSGMFTPGSIAIPNALVTPTIDRQPGKGEKSRDIYQEKYEAARKRFPGDESWTVDEYVKNYNTAINSINNQSLGVKYVSEDISKQLKNEFITGMNLRDWALYDGHGTSTLGKLEGEGKDEGLLKELNMNLGEFKEALMASPQVFITQDGPQPGMYGVEIKEKGKNGKLRTVLIGSNASTQEMTQTSFNMNQKMRALDETPYLIGMGSSGKPVALKPTYTLNPITKQFDTDIQYGTTDSQGKNFKSEGSYYTTLDNGMKLYGMDAIKQMELLMLANSNIIGTNFNYNKLPKGAQPVYSPNP